MSTYHTRPPTIRPGINNSKQDEIIADAHADDTMRDDLWSDWVNGQKQGPNPDEMTPNELGNAYRDMIARQRNSVENER